MRSTLAFFALLSAVGPLAAHAAPTLVSTIDGGYNLDSYDTPELKISNSTGFAFTNAQMVLTAYQPGTLSYGSTQTVQLGTIGANSVDPVIWGSGGPLFSNDYDDQWGNSAAGNPLCVQPYPFCALVGNFKVTFTATWANPAYGGGAGTEVSSVFTPATNASGGFVGWEGLNPDGLSETTYDDHVASPKGVLANIYVGPPAIATPEPAGMILLGLAVGAAGLVAGNRRRA